MSDSLPKYMLLDQNSEEMRDRRIMPLVTYTEQGDKAIVHRKKRITNTISIPKKLSKTESLYNLQYSSKYGVLLIATNNEVIVKTTQQLQQDLLAEKHLDNSNLMIKFSGELFLSPDQEILAICSESLIQFVRTSSLAQTNNIEVPPVSNVNDSNHFLWVDNNNFVSWKFQGNSMLYTIDPNTLRLKLQQRQLPMQFITGASTIHGQLFLISKMIIKIFEPFTVQQPVVKVEIDMADPNHQSPFFQFSYIIDFFKINISSQQFTPDDVYGIAVAFYDVQEEAVDERYLTFAKGDIFNRRSIEIRGYQNLYSSKTSRQLFYNNFDQKTSFSIKRVISSGFICLALQKSQKVYVIDPLEDFQRVNIYDIQGKHQLKNQQGKFLQGMTVMKNMLPIQKVVPQKAEQLLINIISKYNGQFMSLFFKESQTNLTIPYPASVLAIGGQKFYRRYAITSVDGIQDENCQEILKKIQVIKKSPHILSQAQCKKIGQKSDKQGKQPLKPFKKQQQKKEVKEEIKQVQVEKKDSVKKQEKKPQQKEVQQKNNAKKQEVKVQQKAEIKIQQKKPEVKVEDKKPQQKINPFAITAKDFGKPPKTVAQLFASPPKQQTPSSIFSNAPKAQVQTKPTISENSKQTKEVKEQIIPPKEQPKNPFLSFNKGNEPKSLFGLGSESKPLLSNVPNLFNNSKPSNQVKAPAQNIFPSGMFNNSNSSKPITNASTNPNQQFGSLFSPGPTTLFSKPLEDKTTIPTIPNNNVNTNVNVNANVNTNANVNAKKQQEKPTPNIKKPEQTLTTKAQQKLNLNTLFTAPSDKKTAEIPKEQIPTPLNKQQPKIQIQIKKQKQTPSVTITKQMKGEPQSKELLEAQKLKKQSLLQGIRKKASGFATWQKDTFSDLSKDTEPTSLPKIKQFYNKQLKLLSNIKTEFFKQTEEPMAQFYTQSIKKSPTFQRIQVDPNYQQNEDNLKKNLNDYEQISNKMLYYINLLGKKKQNMRASNLPSKNNPEKAASNLTRLTEKNDEKINELQIQSDKKLEELRYINNQRFKQKKKGKRYNFQDQDNSPQEQEIQSKILNSVLSSAEVYHKKQAKTVFISLDTIDPKPKIQLPSFQTKPSSSQPFPKKTGSPPKVLQGKPPLQNPQPNSFAEKIPPKKQKVQVPKVEKVEVKKEEEKKAISQVYQQQQNTELQQLQIPSNKRMISSIQPAQIKGLNVSAQLKQKKQAQVKPKASFPEAKKGSLGVFEGNKLKPKEKQDQMLISQTTSIFSSSNNPNPKSFLAALTNPQSKPNDQKKPVQTKTLGSIFNLNSSQSTGGIFGQKIAAPKIAQNNPTSAPKPNQSKVQEKKPIETQNKEQNKQSSPPVANNNKGNNLQEALKNISLGEKKDENKTQATQKQKIDAPNSTYTPPVPAPSKPPATEQKKPQSLTDSQAQANKPNTLAPSNSASSLNPTPNTSFPNANNAPNKNNVFMGASFGTQPAPQFGSGNNKFLNTASQPNTNGTGFNPNTAKFGGTSNNAPKSFNNFGGQTNIFQQQTQQQNNPSPFVNQGNIFNNNTSASNAPDSNTNQVNGNQGGNIFNQNQNNILPSINNGNMFNNNPNTGGNNPFNKGNNFAQNNTFANNNPLTNNANSANNTPTNVFNAFNQNNGNTNVFANNFNSSPSNNFLANLKPSTIAPPPSNINLSLLQMRK